MSPALDRVWNAEDEYQERDATHKPNNEAESETSPRPPIAEPRCSAEEQRCKEEGPIHSFVVLDGVTGFRVARRVPCGDNQRHYSSQPTDEK